MSFVRRAAVISSCLVFAGSLFAQSEPEPIPNWPAPAFWAAQKLHLDKADAPEQGGLEPEAVDGTVPTLAFTPLNPCRIVDTRGNGFSGQYGPPALSQGVPRDILLWNVCGIAPGLAQAVSLNITVTNTQGPGFIVIYPQGGGQPNASTLNYVAGQTIANAAVVPLGALGGVTVIAGVSGTDLIIDTNGYYAQQTVVNTINGLSGSVSLNPGTDVSITPAGQTLMIGTDATSANTGNTIVRRNVVGGFSAGTVALAGNLTLPTTSSTAGGLLQNGTRLLHTFGNDNLFLGENAGNFTMSGSSNTVTGAFAFTANTLGAENTANGFGSLQSNTMGVNNTAAGYLALRANNTGNGNTAVGHGALRAVTSGSSNIGIGVNGGSNLTTESGNIHVGNVGVAGDATTIRIGTTQTRAFLAGVRGRTTSQANAIPVLIDSVGQLGTTSSSRLVKEEIRDMGGTTEALMRLRPVTFHYKPDLDPTCSRQYGLIAEEVAETFPDLAILDAQGRPETVKYHVLPSLLLNAFQDQQKTVENQRKEIEHLKDRLGRLEAVTQGRAELEGSPR